jgi:ADP-ribosylglycohydrolase
VLLFISSIMDALAAVNSAANLGKDSDSSG